MLSASEIERAALHLVAQRRRREDVAFPDDLPKPDRMDIYRIQRRYTEAVGGGAPPAAYKVSWIPASLLTGPTGECWFAGVPAGRIFDNGASFDSTQYRRMGLECEIACRIGIDSRNQAVPISIMPAVEIIEEPHSNINRDTIGAVLATAIANSGFLFGPETHGWPDVRDRQVMVTRNGATLVSDRLGNILDPATRLQEFLKHAAEFGWNLTDGMVISLGSINSDIWFKPGEEIVGEIEGLGRVSASIR